MSEALIHTGRALPPTSSAALAELAAVEDALLGCEQIAIRTEHTFHGGMYARTVRLEPGTVITGALIKIPTLLIIQGHCLVTVDDKVIELTGYNVCPASAGRKQLFRALSKTMLTMIFPTEAKTVEEAEQQFTDQWAELISQHSEQDVVNITGE